LKCTDVPDIADIAPQIAALLGQGVTLTASMDKATGTYRVTLDDGRRYLSAEAQSCRVALANAVELFTAS
jgi:hypothetical protein